MSTKADRQPSKDNSGADPVARQPYAAVTEAVTGLPTPRKERAVSRALDTTSTVRRLLSVKEAGLYLGLSPWTIRSLGWSGQIPEVRVGRRVLYDRQDLDRFVEASKRR